MPNPSDAPERAPSPTPTGLDAIALAMATLGPVGRMPKAPGTWGSAAALVLSPWAFQPLPLTARCVVLAGVLALGTWAAARAGKLLGSEDPGCVVIDEVLGQWTAFAPFHLAPPLGGGFTSATPWELLALFGLFRLFDILKPWPIRWADSKVRGGLGVMLDDLLAGLMAAGAYALIRPFV